MSAEIYLLHYNTFRRFLFAKVIIGRRRAVVFLGW